MKAESLAFSPSPRGFNVSCLDLTRGASIGIIECCERGEWDPVFFFFHRPLQMFHESKNGLYDLHAPSCFVAFWPHPICYIPDERHQVVALFTFTPVLNASDLT